MIYLNDSMDYYITDEEFQQLIEDATKKYSTTNSKGQITQFRNKLTDYRENVDRLDIALIRDLYWLRCLSREQIETYYFSPNEAGDRIQKFLDRQVIKKVDKRYKGEAYQLHEFKGFREFRYSYRLFIRDWVKNKMTAPNTLCLTSKIHIERQLKTNKYALKIKQVFGMKDYGESYGDQLLYNYSLPTWYQDPLHYGGSLKKSGVDSVLRLFGDHYCVTRVRTTGTTDERMKHLLQLRDVLSNQHRKAMFTVIFLYEEVPTAEELQLFGNLLRVAGFTGQNAVITNEQRLVPYLQEKYHIYKKL